MNYSHAICIKYSHELTAYSEMKRVDNYAANQPAQPSLSKLRY